MQKQDVIEALTSLNEDIEQSIVAIDDENAVESWDRDSINNWEFMKDNLETISDYVESANELVDMILSADFDVDDIIEQAQRMKGK